MSRVSSFLAGVVSTLIVVTLVRFNGPQQAVADESVDAAKKAPAVRLASVDFWLLFSQHNNFKSLVALRNEIDAAKKATNAESGRMKDLERKEVEILNDIRTGIEQMVSDYCKEYGIDVVLRCDRTRDPKSTKREDVLRRLNDPVIFCASHLDITEEAIQEYFRQRSRESNKTVEPPAPAAQEKN